MPCTTRRMISSIAPALPVFGVSDRAMDPSVKMAKPALYIFTRPNMSPIRPKVTTSTAVTTRYPMRIHSR